MSVQYHGHDVVRKYGTLARFRLRQLRDTLRRLNFHLGQSPHLVTIPLRHLFQRRVLRVFIDLQLVLLVGLSWIENPKSV